MDEALKIESGEIKDRIEIAQLLGWYILEQDIWNSDAKPKESGGKFTDELPPNFLQDFFATSFEISRHGWSWTRERDGTFRVFDLETYQNIGVSSFGAQDIETALLAALFRAKAFTGQ